MAAKPTKSPAAGASKDGGKKDDGSGAERRKRLMLGLMVVGALVLGGGGTAGVLYFFGLLGSGEPAHRKTAVLTLGAPALVDLPEALVDLKVGTCRSPYLRFIMTVEVSSESVAAVNDAMPRLQDAIQQHLRGKERQDLAGTEGADRLRNEAREIVNRVVAPVTINGVLFKKFVLQ